MQNTANESNAWMIKKDSYWMDENKKKLYTEWIQTNDGWMKNTTNSIHRMSSFHRFGQWLCQCL